jgi:thioesterase domain-containing protein
LQSCGLNDDEAPLSSIAAMADRYAREIRAVHPAGPYVLAGASMGGVLALEVARRLLDAGGRVALLGLFDTHCPGLGQAGGESPWHPHRWPALYRRLDAGQRAWLWRRIGFRLWRLPAMRLRQWFGQRRSVPRELRIHLVEQANQLALAAYRPRHYPGRVVLFKATQTGAAEDPTLGWGGVADGVDVIDVDARHDSVVEQPELVERFRESIAAG